MARADRYRPVLSIVSDLVLAGYPIVFLRGLQVKLRVKIALCVLMGAGVMSVFPLPLHAACNLSSDNLCSTAVCCTVRTVLSGAVKGPDVTWNIVPNVAWRLPEVNIGIVCANAPILRPLYLFFRGRLATQQSVSHTAYSKEKTDVSRASTF